MFDKTITVKMPDGKKLVLTKEDVVACIIAVNKQSDRAEAIQAKHDELQRLVPSLTERLDAANAQLTQYGHMSGF